MRLQWPNNCSTARLLVVNEHIGGVGSTQHILANFLHIALATNRTLVRRQPSYYADPCACPERRDCCLLEPISKCFPHNSFAPGRKFKRVRLSHLFRKSRIVFLASHRNSRPAGFFGARVLRRHHPKLAAMVRRFGYRWYRSRLQAFLLRPKPWLAARIAELAPPRPYVGLYIREGDKGTESPLLSLCTYMAAVARAAAALNTSQLFVATESAAQLAALRRRHGGRYTITATSGHHRAITRGASQRVMMEEGKLSRSQEMAIAVVNALLLSQAGAFVGMMDSNFSRLALELMAVALTPGRLPRNFSPRVGSNWRRFRDGTLQE